jgi:hypothetical protein
LLTPAARPFRLIPFCSPQAVASAISQGAGQIVDPASLSGGNANAVSNAINQGTGGEPRPAPPCVAAHPPICPLLACSAFLQRMAAFAGAFRRGIAVHCTALIRLMCPSLPDPLPVAACSSRATSSAGGFSQESSATAEAVASAVATVCGGGDATAAANAAATATARVSECRVWLGCPLCGSLA